MATLAEIREQYPQYQDMPDSALADAMHRKFYSDIPQADFYSKIGFQPVGVGEDMARSGGSGMLRGAAQFAGTGGDIAKGLGSSLEPGGVTAQAAEQHGVSVPQARQEMLSAMPSFLRRHHENPAPVIGSKEIAGAIDKVAGAPVTQYKPQTMPGQFAGTIGEFAGNPISYMGPGGAALKAGGVVLAGAGSEAAGQATKGTAYEGPARIAGAVAGGAGAAKMLGPSAPKAAIPTAQELRAAADQGYGAARASGLTLDPKGVASWAATAEQQLNARGFTGGKNGTAPKTLAVLSDLQSPPAGSVIGASNIDALRASLRNIAEEVQPSAGGAVKPTPDAAAASKVLRHLGGYTENIPRGHIMAGDAATYVRETKRANANYGAGSRVRDFDARLTKAERATDRQIAGSVDNQIKQKAAQLLEGSAGKGLSAAEKQQLELIIRGGPVSNTLRQLGRAGAGVVPFAAHAVTAAATGGANLPLQAALAAGLYGARKGSEAITNNRAKKLGEMLAKRSPEYERRVAALPQGQGQAPNVAALVRALLAH